MQNLDGMAYNKMNVFHWHIGAYSGRHVYSQQDVASIVEHARRVAVDPTNEANYPFLSALLSELSSVFPDTYLHLGGDEVPFDCWQSNPKVRQFMADRGFGQNYSLLENYYENRIISIATSGANRSVVVWQELLDNAVSLPRGTIVHVWKGGWQDEMAKVTARGYPALLSSCWYLDYIKMSDWKDFYACESVELLRIGCSESPRHWRRSLPVGRVRRRQQRRQPAVAARLRRGRTAVEQPDRLRPEVAEPRYAGQRCRMLYRGLNPRAQRQDAHVLRSIVMEAD
uniref:beta-N-acetylhexosaminidase n=1 Tax=Macrostomum lignano TaxID=282301 RepID=A0A1I8FNH6_9PLAT